jgi:hypothetical protein
MTVLDIQKAKPSFSIGEAMRNAARDYGKSVASQLVEMALLAAATGKLTPKDYYFYGLYNDRKYSLRDKKRFVGQAAQIAMNWICNDGQWREVAKDKITFAQYFEDRGFPVARIVAAYHPNRMLERIAPLRNAEDIKAFLRQKPSYPLFSKPARSIDSLGAARLEYFDETSNDIVLGGAQRVAIDRFAEETMQFQDGYVFQEVLHPHPDIAAICGDRIANVRMVVLLGDSGPELVRALWKVPAGSNIADNIWRGNILASVDAETGRVLGATQGPAPKWRDLDAHPDTGRAITGTSLPQWADARALCLDAAKTMPGLKLQAWDISLCESGPVLGEVNFGGDYYLPQLATGKGMLDAGFVRLLDSCSPSWRAKVFISVVRRRLSLSLHGLKTRGRRARPSSLAKTCGRERLSTASSTRQHAHSD